MGLHCIVLVSVVSSMLTPCITIALHCAAAEMRSSADGASWTRLLMLILRRSHVSERR